MWPFNNLHRCWEWPWKSPAPANCDSNADHVIADYSYDDTVPHYKVMGVIKTRKTGWAKKSWRAHTEVWLQAKGKESPEPVGESLFCIYFRSKSKIYLVQGYDRTTKRPVDLPSNVEERVRQAVIKSKNKWRWF